MAELEERIEILQSEIARVQAQIDRKQAGRAAADALFGAGPASEPDRQTQMAHACGIGVACGLH